MKPISALRNMIIGLYRSIKRFPVTILMSAATACMLIAISELQLPYDSDFRKTLTRIAMILALGIPLSLCIKVFSERKNGVKAYKLMAYYGAGAIILLLYYFFFLTDLNMVTTTRYTAVSLALYLGFLYIPYLPGKEQYEMYIIKIFTGFFTTVIYSVILYAGLAAILFTIDKLLGIHIDSKVYYYAWLFVAFVFAPSYFLAGIPLKGESISTESYPKLLRILVLYIVMPLLSVYTGILYIYFVKIIITRQWPVGMVSHLVLWYSVIVVIVLFFITPIRNRIKWADKFTVWAPRIIIPILIMMFVSMNIRISAYGVTENRYYVILLGIWVSGIMLYFSLVKRRINIVIPAALSLIALIAVFGPLSSYSVSKASQNGRLEKILTRNNMLVEGKIQKAPSNISTDDIDETSRILDYFSRSHSLSDVKYLPEGFSMGDMEKVFGFKYQGPIYHSPEGYFYIMRSQTEGAADIKGYDYMFDSRSLYNSSQTADNTISASYDYASAVLKISSNGNVLYQKDIKEFASKFAGKYNAPTKENQVPSEEMTLTEENDKMKVKVIFMNLSGRVDTGTGNVEVQGAEFYVLVKVK